MALPRDLALTDEERDEILASEWNMRISTVSPSGRINATPLWFAPIWLRVVLAAVMLLAFIVFVASISQPNPTMVGVMGLCRSTNLRAIFLTAWTVLVPIVAVYTLLILIGTR